MRLSVVMICNFFHFDSETQELNGIALSHGFDSENDLIISNCLFSINNLNELTIFVMNKLETED